MEPFRIHILGCGSALPTLRHNASSQVVEIREKLFMIDCGEGTQMQLRRSRLRFTKINHIFISHIHGDHCFGLIGLISTFGMLGRVAPLHVYATPEYRQMLNAQMEMFCGGLEYEVVFHPINTTRCEIIYEDRSLTVKTIPLCHRVPCCGFLFEEKNTLPHIRRDMVDFYKIPVSQINNIKLGKGWTTEDGEFVPSSRLTQPAAPARSYAYCSDTRYMPELHKQVKGVSTLYHEATYSSENKERAKIYYHSTANEAARVASDAGAGQLIIGHYSARYDTDRILLDEAKKTFEKTFAADEMAVFNV